MNFFHEDIRSYCKYHVFIDLPTNERKEPRWQQCVHAAKRHMYHCSFRSVLHVQESLAAWLTRGTGVDVVIAMYLL